MTTLTAAQASLRKLADPKKAATYRGFFKDPGEDIFLGVTTALIRGLTVEFEALPLSDVRKLMRSRVHDERSLAHAILVRKFEKAGEAGQTRFHKFYLRNRHSIRSWDGVDDSAPTLVGRYLMNREKSLLFELVRSDSLWDRRIAIVATLPIVRGGAVADALRLVEMVLSDKEDLIHKAAGWILREVGKQDQTALREFLARHHTKMPRTMFRYAIERFSKAERDRLLKGEF